MRGEGQFFGGESLEEYGKKLEAENKETEVMPYGELLTNVGEQMMKVVSTLENERKLAAEIRGMGGKVSRDTAEQIMNLERRKNDLLKVYNETLEPVRKEAAMAFIDNAEMLVPKPENLELLMSDPDTLEVTDDMIVERQSAQELMDLEKDLSAEAEKAQEEMISLVEQMHAAKTDMPKTLEQALRPPDPQLHDAYMGILEAKLGELQNYVRGINAKLEEVRMNLGLVKRLESKEDRKAA